MLNATKMNGFLAHIRQFGRQYFLYALLAYFSYLMLLITLQYVPPDLNAAFLGIKQQEIQHGYYQVAFFAHVYTSVFTLLAGFTQFSERIRKQYAYVHRLLGKLYIAIVLLFSAPSGLIIGLHANGGLFSQIAFCLLAVLWFWFTWMAYQKVRLKNFEAHRRYMWRSYALALSAITLRLWKWIIVALFEPLPIDAYRTVAWLGWVGNLLLVEWYLRSRRTTRTILTERTELTKKAVAK